MEHILVENQLTAREFQALRMEVGWGAMDPGLAEISIKNSEYTVCTVVEGRVVGMARVIGDGGYYHYIQDAVVKPDFQGNGFGHAMVKKCIKFIKSIIPEDSSVLVGVMSERENELFYEGFGFRRRPNEFEGAGMIKFMTK